MENYGESLLWKNNLVLPIPPSEYRYLKKNYQFVLDRFPDKKTKIVEIWPGTGYLAQFFLINGYENLTLVELSADFHVAQKQRLGKNWKTVFVNMEWSAYLSENPGIDILISRQMAEHLSGEELVRFFKNGVSSLNEWGIFVTETINAQNFFYASFLRYIDLTHKISFTTDSFLQLFRLSADTNHEWAFRKVSQLNFFDFLNLRLQGSLPQVCESATADTPTSFDGRKSFIANVITVIVRDVFRTLSEWLSSAFSYGRTAEAVGSEFLIFCIEKWKKR